MMAGTMHIDAYDFGRIEIDGQIYTKDLLIVRGEVRSPWWREAGGHVYAPRDLGDLIEAAPELVVLGTGYHGSVQVTGETREVFERMGSTVVELPTAGAVDEINRAAAAGRDLAAALHLTC
jgi:hypothetical protein